MNINDYKFLYSRPVDPKNMEDESVFQNKFLEKITVTSPLIAFIVNVPLVVATAVFSWKKGYAAGFQALFIWIGAFVFWSLAEYLIHRFIYHRRTGNPILQNIQILFHGFHHKHPSDKKHLLYVLFYPRKSPA